MAVLFKDRSNRAGFLVSAELRRLQRQSQPFFNMVEGRNASTMIQFYAIIHLVSVCL